MKTFDLYLVPEAPTIIEVEVSQPGANMRQPCAFAATLTALTLSASVMLLYMRLVDRLSYL